jgi:hypothetical protein
VSLGLSHQLAAQVEGGATAMAGDDLEFGRLAPEQPRTGEDEGTGTDPDDPRP